MKEVNYREDDWYEAKSALAPFASANWVGGLFNNLEKVSNNLSEEQKYPVNNEKMNYVELYKYFQEAEMGRSTEKYILTGEW
nr:hypothetical protein [Listeria marthii]